MLIRLFISFFEIGLFTFGGGYAMLPMLERITVSKNNWLTKEELLEIITIAQMTPGTIAINLATFIGMRIGKLKGALVASFAVILPSFIIVTLIYYLFGHSFDNPILQKAFFGAKAAVAALILSAVIRLFKSGVKGAMQVALFVLAFLLLFFGVHPIWVIIWGAVSGIVIFGLIPIFKAKKA